MKARFSETYNKEIVDEIFKPEWINLHPTFQFCEKTCLVKMNDIEIRVKERTIKALKVLSTSFRFQRSSKVLPTKEQIFFECEIPLERNMREFKINKELFPYPELRKLVKYDRRRRGYYLCLV